MDSFTTMVLDSFYTRAMLC